VLLLQHGAEVESSLDDSFLHSHDEEEIMKHIAMVSKAKAIVVSKEYFQSKDEVAKKL
jgi:hypothetical protein